MEEGYVSYTYEVLQNNIRYLQRVYPFLKVNIIGKSVENRNIYALQLGKGSRKILLSGGCHACEWITVPVLMKWVEEICNLYINKEMVYGRCIETLFSNTTVHIVPMMNPDGIQLQIQGVLPENLNYRELIQWNKGEIDFSKWKANIRGVDLNRNFDAKWKEYKEIEKKEKIEGPWFELYGGPCPESEPEVKAIVHYTREEDFDMVLAYHTQGEVIYWNFEGFESPYAKQMGEKLAKASGYCLDVPSENASYAGYKDWFIQEFQRPGYTIECGIGENPLPITQLDTIYRQNFELILIAAWGE